MIPLREAEKILGVGRSTILTWIAEGRLASEKRFSDAYGSQRFVSRAEVQRLLREREAEAERRRAAKKGGRPIKLPKPPNGGNLS